MASPAGFLSRVYSSKSEHQSFSPLGAMPSIKPDNIVQSSNPEFMPCPKNGTIA